MPPNMNLSVEGRFYACSLLCKWLLSAFVIIFCLLNCFGFEPWTCFYNTCPVNTNPLLHIWTHWMICFAAQNVCVFCLDQIWCIKHTNRHTIYTYILTVALCYEWRVTTIISHAFVSYVSFHLYIFKQILLCQTITAIRIWCSSVSTRFVWGLYWLQFSSQQWIQ